MKDWSRPLCLSIVCMLSAVGCRNHAYSNDESRQPPSHAGLLVINPQFDAAEVFYDGLAAIRIGDDKTGAYGYIDTAGKIVFTR